MLSYSPGVLERKPRMGEQQPIMGNISAGEFLYPFDKLVYLPR